LNSSRNYSYFFQNKIDADKFSILLNELTAACKNMQ
jgi:hypothetical protein